MKKASVICILLSALLFSCNDGENSDMSASFRIKESIYESPGASFKSEYIYEEELLVQINDFELSDNGVWDETGFVEIVYGENNSISTTYSKSNDEWQIRGKVEYIFRNNLVTEEIHYNYTDSNWVFNYKDVYEYTYGNLQKVYQYKFEEGNYIISRERAYSYEGSRISEDISYMKLESDSMILQDYSLYTYAGPVLSNIELTFWAGWNTYGEDVYHKALINYTFSNNLVQEKEYKNWDPDLEEYVDSRTEGFSYDRNMCLVEWSFWGGTVKRYSYEEGKGNARYFIYDPVQSIKPESRVK